MRYKELNYLAIEPFASVIPQPVSVVEERLNVHGSLQLVHHGDRIVLELFPIQDEQVLRLEQGEPSLQVAGVVSGIQTPGLQGLESLGALDRVGRDHLVERVREGGGVVVGPHVMIPAVSAFAGANQDGDQFRRFQESMRSTRYKVSVEVGGGFLEEVALAAAATAGGGGGVGGQFHALGEKIHVPRTTRIYITSCV